MACGAIIAKANNLPFNSGFALWCVGISLLVKIALMVYYLVSYLDCKGKLACKTDDVREASIILDKVFYKLRNTSPIGERTFIDFTDKEKKTLGVTNLNIMLHSFTDDERVNIRRAQDRWDYLSNYTPYQVYSLPRKKA